MDIETAERTATAFGQEIRRARKAQGLDQRQLALVAGVSPQTVHAIEHGKPTVQLAGLLSVLRAVGFDLTLSRRGLHEAEGFVLRGGLRHRPPALGRHVEAQNHERAAVMFRRMAEAKLRERRRRYRSTTMGERIEEACALGDFGRELQAGLSSNP